MSYFDACFETCVESLRANLWVSVKINASGLVDGGGRGNFLAESNYEAFSSATDFCLGIVDYEDFALFTGRSGWWQALG